MANLHNVIGFACLDFFGHLLNFNIVVKRYGKLLVIAALVLTTGAHWAALQTIAWTTMLAANLASQQTLTEAMSQTFDGEHPCPLCKAITAAKKSEKKSEAIAPVLKMEYPPAGDRFVLLAPKGFLVFPACDFLADSAFLKPPVPPPRSFQV